MSASIQAPFSQTTTTPTQGRFISFEGTEGVGKTTAIEQLCARLQARGIDYLRTREPGGSPFAERLREILLDPNTAINDDTELLLMFAARCDHMQQVILPALQRGTWVICDRFTDSTVAYQGFGRADGDAIVRAKIDMLIEQFVVQLPELTLWLDLPVLEGMARANKRSALTALSSKRRHFLPEYIKVLASLLASSLNVSSVLMPQAARMRSAHEYGRRSKRSWIFNTHFHKEISLFQ